MNKYQEALNYLFRIGFVVDDKQKEEKYKAISTLQELIDSVEFIEHCAEANDEVWYERGSKDYY